MIQQLTITQARALALAAQGFIGAAALDAPVASPIGGQLGAPAQLDPTGNVYPPRTVLDVVDRLGLLQIDSVSVFERAHYLPLFSRLGAFKKSDLDDLTGATHPTLIEYWAHEASFIRTDRLPLYRFRMKSFEDRYASNPDSFANRNRDFLQWLLDEVGAKGPLTIREVEHDRKVRTGNWWGWSDVKYGLEYLFAVGELVSAGRDKFSRRYALPAQILPETIANHQIDERDAKLSLLAHAAKVVGVGTLKDIADYHRLKPTVIKPLIAELVANGILVEVSVDDWLDAAYVHNCWLGSPLLATAANNGNQASAEALAAKFLAASPTTILSPFDPVVWFRERALRLFDFEYRIEIYTPAPKRIYGYYTLPILHRGRIVGRIDLKSDRKAKVLLVQSIWQETWLSARESAVLARDLAKHLKVVAKWQELEAVSVQPVGNLSLELAAHFA
jgi:uncharacterized protein YcaQ